MDRGAWGATVHGVLQSQTRLKRLSTHAHAKVNLNLTCYKNDSKWIISLNVKCVRLSEESIGENLLGLKLGKGFLDLPPKHNP